MHHRFASLRPLVAVLLLGLGLSGTTLFAVAGDRSDDRGAAVVAAARGHLGESYTWGATGPATWDCSGFTSVLWHTVGRVPGLPRVARDQQAWTVAVPREQALLGDLVFFGEPVGHVGIVSGRSADRLLLMLDASSSRGGVVERPVWTAGLVRFGRVPRADMPAVLPWTPPPAPAPTPVPSATVPTQTVPVPAVPAPTVPVPTVPAPSGGRGASMPGRARPTVAAAPAGGSATSGQVLVPLPGLPAVQRGRSSPVAARAAHLASTVAGATRFTDTGLVRTAWRNAGGSDLPTDRAQLVARAVRVALRDARSGDLVVYGSPAVHVGLYLGGGRMADASKVLGRVVVRPVYASATVRVLRLRG